jgi:hypothetical protein
MSDPKLFTIEQAEKTLPLVRRVVADIVKTFERRTELMSERHKLRAAPIPGSNQEDRAIDLENQIRAAEDEISRYQSELETIGVELKDYNMGLVDFYSQYQDRLVYLCWKIEDGEKIQHWHELNTGFRGRVSITPEERNNFQDRMTCRPGR